MGLDNGIIIETKNVKTLKKVAKKDTVDEFVDRTRLRREDGETIYQYDLLYWRKCWNVREVILSILEDNNIADENNEEYEWCFDTDVLEQILDCLKNQCYHKEWWNDTENQTIWTWKEIKNTLKENLEHAYDVLNTLKKLKPEDYTIVFYDSY